MKQSSGVYSMKSIFVLQATFDSAESNRASVGQRIDWGGD